MKEIPLKPHQFVWMKYVFCIWCIGMLLLGVFSVAWKNGWCMAGLFVLPGIGILYQITVRNKICKIRKISERIEDFIRKNSLYQSHYAIRRTLFREKDVEIMDYYPQITYTEIPCDNIFRLKFRLDGSPQAQRFRELEADTPSPSYWNYRERQDTVGTIYYLLSAFAGGSGNIL